jgi:dTDP-4-dehydrorhamnose 3,5-epimerase
VKVHSTSLPGVLRVEPAVFADERGHFFEVHREQRYAEHGIADHFVQDNLSLSTRGVLRGLHFQWPHPQAKLAQVVDGEVFDVAVDLRVGSPTFGQWFGTLLSGDNHHQLYIPEGFAHGFCVLSETARFLYKCSAPYVPAADQVVRWDDPAIGIAWPVAAPLLSPKDAAAPRLADVPRERLPVYAGG